MMVKDPVCGMTVEEKAAMTAVHEGKTSRACSARGKTGFEQGPLRYANA